MRRLAWILASFLTVSLLLVGSWRAIKPWALNQGLSFAQRTLKTSAQLELQVEHLDVQLLPPAIKLRGIKIANQNKDLQYLSQLNFPLAEARLDFLQLLGGRLSLSMVHLEQASLEIDLDKYTDSEKPLEDINLQPLFEALKLFPINRIILSDLQLHLKDSQHQLGLQLAKAQLVARLSNKQIEVEAQLPEVKILPLESSLRPLLLSTELLVQITAESIAVEEFNLTHASKLLSLKAHSNSLRSLLKAPKVFFSASGEIDLTTLTQGLREFSFLHRWIPDASSQAKMDFKGTLNQWALPDIKGQVELTKGNIGPFQFEKLNADLGLNPKVLELKSLMVQGPVGQAQIADLSVNLDSTLNFKGKLLLGTMDIQQLLQVLGLKTVPVDLDLSGNLECTGEVKSKYMNCSGKLSGDELSVRTAIPLAAKEIVGIPQFTASGNFTVDSEKVKYTSDVTMGSSSGKSKGEIGYESGFKIDYQTDSLDFKNIRNLAGLKIQGQAAIEGTTVGNSSYGIINMLVKTSNFEFEDFFLGEIHGPLTYHSGVLSVQLDKGLLQNTQYNGTLVVDLNNSLLQANIKFPYLEAPDLLLALQKKMSLPIEIQGRGQAEVQAEGPFSLGAMSYNLNAQFKRGKIATENFDEAKISIQAKAGQVQVNDTFIRKNKALIVASGWANPDGRIGLLVEGKNFKLEELDILKPVQQFITGDFNFRMKLNEHILNPDISLRGTISDSALTEFEMSNSDLALDINANSISGIMQLFGNKVRGDFILPRNAQELSQIKISTQDWDFATLLALFGNEELRKEYKSNLTMNLNLESPDGGIFKSTGLAQIEKFQLSRGGLSLYNEKPMLIKFNEGLASLEDFILIGPDAKLAAKGTNFSPDNLDVIVSGKFDMKILQVFTPFFDDLGGTLKADLRLAGKINSVEAFGDIKTENGFFKINGFPHPFEQLAANLTISQKRLTLQNLRGLLAGGQLAADGNVLINGIGDVQVNVRGRLQGATFNVPDKFKTSGNADIIFSGNWFPYTLSGSYRIFQGLIEKDFTEESKLNTSVRHSIYLPKELTAKSFDPVNLDLQVYIDKPVQIKNPLVEGAVTGNVLIKGPPEQPKILGQVKVMPGTKLLFRDKIFEVQSGNVKFLDTPDINPELYITARSRVDIYDVSLLLQGKAKDPQLLLTSQPPLEEQDIISLLALGITSQKLDADVSSEQQAAQLTSQIQSALLSANPLGRQLKESTGFEIKFSSTFDETANTSINKATLSKDITKKINVSATKPFNTSDNFDVRLKYLFNDKVSAVGTYEKIDNTEGLGDSNKDAATGIFGLDLEYKLEFR